MISYLAARSGVSSGWLLVAVVSIAVVSYALGCCNGAVMVSRGILKDDIRQHGSGNGGLTNFCRIHGGVLSVVVILIDMLKAVVSVALAGYIFSYLSVELVPFSKYWAGLFCILGHMFPITYQFRGGKGVLSSGAIALMIDWRLALLIWGCFLLCAILTKFVSLGSCVGAVAFPIGSYFIFRDTAITVIAVIMGALVIFKHRGNIMRLIKGAEPRFTLKWGASQAAENDPERPEPESPAEAPEETPAEGEAPAENETPAESEAPAGEETETE